MGVAFAVEAPSRQWLATQASGPVRGLPPPTVYSHPWMKRVLTALILIPIVLALVFLGPKWLITLAVAAVAMMAGWEFLGLAER